MTSKRRITLHPRTVELLKKHGILDEKNRKSESQKLDGMSAINNVTNAIKEKHPKTTKNNSVSAQQNLLETQSGEENAAHSKTSGNIKLGQISSSTSIASTFLKPEDNMSTSSTSHSGKLSSTLSNSSDNSISILDSQDPTKFSETNKELTDVSAFCFKTDKTEQKGIVRTETDRNRALICDKIEGQTILPDIHEYKNEKGFLNDIFTHLNSIQSFLYSDEPYKLNSLYQKNLIDFHNKRLKSLKVSKRTLEIDIPFYYNYYKQFKQQKLQVKKKLAVVCSRELRRALQRTGKTNPNLKGRRIPKLLSQKEKRLKHTNRKKVDLLNEKKREQKKMEYLLGQTELFAHFVLKGDKKEMEKVKKDIISSQNEQEKTEDTTAELSQQSVKPIQDHLVSQDLTTDQNKMIAHSMSFNQNKTDISSNKGIYNDSVDENDKKEDKSIGSDTMPETLSLSKVTLPDPPELSFFKGTLKDYQKKGVSWLINLYKNNINGILADDMGLGKTVQTISLLCYLSEYQNKKMFLIVTPVSTLGNWEAEIKRFAPIFDINVFTGADRAIITKKKLKNRKKRNERNNKSQDSTLGNTSSLSDEILKRKNTGDENIDFSEEYYNIAVEMSPESDDPRPSIILTSYNLLSDKKLKKIKFDYLVCDEAQAIKSNKSLRWQNINTIISKNRLLLTGTPIQNNLAELWSLLHFIMPSLFNDHNTFLTFFSNEKSVKKETLDRLHLILKPFMLRREKKDVKHELGKKIEKEVICHMTPYQKKIYQSIDSVRDENVVMQLRKIVNHPYLYLREETSSGFYIEKQDLVLRTRQIDWKENIKHFTEGITRNMNFLLEKNPEVSDLKHKKGHDILYRDPVEQKRINRIKSRKTLETIDLKDMVSIQRGINISKTESIVPHQYPEIGNDIIFHTNDGDFTEIQIIERMHRLKYADSDENVKRIKLQPGEIEILGISSMSPQKNISPENYVQDLCRKEENHYLVNKFFADCTPSVYSSHYNPGVRTILSENIHRNSFDTKITSSAVSPFDVMANLKDSANTPLLNHDGSSRNTFSSTKTSDLYSLYPSHMGHKGSLVSVYNTGKYNNFINPVRIPPFSLFDSGKFRVLHQMLKEMRDKRILIYFQMTKMMDLFETYCKDMNYSFVRLDGQLKPFERKKIVDLFQTQNIFIFMLSTRAGGLGLNLTKANTVIFYDSDWNPTVDQQAMDRAYRLGNKENVTVYRLITADSVENKMRDSAEMKEEIHRLVIDGGEYGV